MGSGKGKARRVASAASPRAISSLVVRPDGREDWRIGGEADGDLHRDDAPAVEEVDGTKEWWFDGEIVDEQTVKTKQTEIRERLTQLEKPGKVNF